MKVGDVVEFIQMGIPPESAEAHQASVPPFQVGGDEVNVLGHAFKQRPSHLPAEYGDVQFWILHSQVVNDRHRHGDVAQGGEAYDEEFLHFCPYSTGFNAGSLYIFICL